MTSFLLLLLVLVITGCGKKKENVSFLVWYTRVVGCGRLRIVCVRLLEFCVSLPVVCGRLWQFTGSLWSFSDGFWSFAGGLWSSVLVCCGLWSLHFLLTTVNGLGLKVLILEGFKWNGPGEETIKIMKWRGVMLRSFSYKNLLNFSFFHWNLKFPSSL